MWQTLRVINTARYSVALQCTPDNDFDHADCDVVTLRGIRNGRYAPYVFRVVVIRNGHIIGADYLGGSIYDNPADFAREHIGIVAKGRADGVTYCCYFPSLLRAAIADARKTVG